ncbi:MAG: N-acetylgalactosamine-6-sulfatase [Saprospiraceae bacterium]|nr:MAG: N-acetylgalactosamine-6-sulfatase [Saprospiraceae bacterium]
MKIYTFVLLVITTITAGFSYSAPKTPNIVLIVIDDLGYGDMGCYGNDIHPTPNIDKLAAEGMVMTDFHTNGCVCSPTRAALLTGQYQQRSGVESAIGFTKEIGVALPKTMIAEELQKAGYKSGVFGKWHVGHVSLFGPNDQGFDESWVSNNSPDYHTHVSRVGELDWFKNQQLNEEPGYLTDLITKHTNDFIEENHDQPFFAFVSHVACHFPFQGPDDPPHRTIGKIWHDTKYGPLPESEYKRAYRDMLIAVDNSVGETVATLERLGLRENTLIFITSDNGAYSWVGSNGPYRGQKGDLFEGGHRVPAIANWPGHIQPGTETAATSMTMDLLPTFLHLAGIEPPKDVAFDGTDLSSVWLQGKSLPNRTLYWRFNNFYTKTEAYAIREGHWKYVKNKEGQYLFNLKKDPRETHNLSGNKRKKVTRFQQRFSNWEKDVTSSEKR